MRCPRDAAVSLSFVDRSVEQQIVVVFHRGNKHHVEMRILSPRCCRRVPILALFAGDRAAKEEVVGAVTRYPAIAVAGAGNANTKGTLPDYTKIGRQRVQCHKASGKIALHSRNIRWQFVVACLPEVYNYPSCPSPSLNLLPGSQQ